MWPLENEDDLLSVALSVSLHLCPAAAKTNNSLSTPSNPRNESESRREEIIHIQSLLSALSEGEVRKMELISHLRRTTSTFFCPVLKAVVMCPNEKLSLVDSCWSSNLWCYRLLSPPATVIMEHSADWGCMTARARERSVVHAGADNAASKMDLVNLPLPLLVVCSLQRTNCADSTASVGRCFQHVISSS